MIKEALSFKQMLFIFASKSAVWMKDKNLQCIEPK